MRRVVVTVAIAVGIAAAGGIAIYAASGSTSDQGGPGRGGAAGPVFVGGPMGGGASHGEFQNGEVTGITDDSITVKSDDDYTKTYVIDDETEMNGDIAKGDDVSVMATTDGSTATAESVVEMGTMPQRRGGGPPDGGDGGPPDDGN